MNKYFIKSNSFLNIILIFSLGLIISTALIFAHPYYSSETIDFPINNDNTITSLDMDNSGQSVVRKISDKNTSGFICNIKEKELESSCRLEIWLIDKNNQKGIDLSKFQNLKIYAHFQSPTNKDFLRVSFRNFEPTIKTGNMEQKYKYNLVELAHSELSKPINVDFKRLIVPNWWMNKVRDQNIKSEVDLTNIHYIEIATGLHASPGEYYLNASQLSVSREIISKTKLYEYLLILWAALIIILFIVISINLQFKVRKTLKNKRDLQEINESLSIRSEKLETINQTDEMTGTLNRNGMEQKLKDCINNKLFPITIVMVDIDYFKKINDVYGHQKGDSVLINLGKLLNNFIENEESVSRFGGEEFLIILPEAYKHEISHRLETLRKSIEAYDMELDYSVTASIGYASCKNIDGFNTIIERADKALYEAKNSGRNCVVFFKE